MNGEVRRVILVDELGFDADGLDYSERPRRKAVRAGFVIASPVILQYPDGRQVKGQEVRITPKGMEQMSRSLGLDAGRRH